MKPNDAAIRKRSQIAKANRTMFIWIAVASALVGVALVVSIFLAQKLFYNEKVLGEKQNTVSVINHNNEIVPELEDQVRVLDTNSDLASVKANSDDQAIQVILDALPSDANSFALGSSLQNKLLVGINGLSIESLQIDPVVGVETLTGEDALSASTTTDSAEVSDNEITFQFVVRGDQDALRKVLENLERSIRTIVVTSVRIETSSNGTQMTVQGKAFYEPAKTIELEKKVVKP
jgi:hypothetical protein